MVNWQNCRIAKSNHSRVLDQISTLKMSSIRLGRDRSSYQCRMIGLWRASRCIVRVYIFGHVFGNALGRGLNLLWIRPGLLCRWISSFLFCDRRCTMLLTSLCDMGRLLLWLVRYGIVGMIQSMLHTRSILHTFSGTPCIRRKGQHWKRYKIIWIPPCSLSVRISYWPNHDICCV